MIHPRFRTLERFVDNELDLRTRRRTADHLADCARCRERLEWLNSLPERAARATHVQAKDGMLDIILERRASGERAILPTAGAGSSGGRDFRTVGAVAAALLAIVVAGVVLLPSAGRVQAQRSELRFDPAEPRSGDRVTVEYRSHGTMPNVDRLILRARFRTPTTQGYPDEVVHTIADTLRRMDDGMYGGSFILADSIVYAVFAVETPDKKHLDSNGDRLWEILSHNPSGDPLFEALDQRRQDMMGRSWEEAHASARRMAELYPEQPKGWRMRLGYEREVLGEAADTLLPHYRDRFRRLDGRLVRHRALPPETISSMYYLARHVEDSIRGAYWLKRLLIEHPSHDISLQHGLNDLVRGHGYESWRDVWRHEEPIRDPTTILEDMERLWRERGPVGSTRIDVFQYVALTLARAAGDVDAYREWVQRRHEARPDDPISSAFALVRFPPTRDEGMAWIRSIYERMVEVPDSNRLLRYTPEEQRKANSGTIRFVLRRLSNAILEDGRPEAALDTLRLAASHGWDSSLFREVADLELRVGDTLAAMASLARAAVDPVAGQAIEDSVGQITGKSIEPAEWRRLKRRARGEMRERVLAQADRHSIDGERIDLMDAHGRRYSLEQITGGEVAAIGFWSRWCGPAVVQLDEIQRVMSGLRDRGIPSFLITEEEIDEDLLGFLEQRGVSIPIYQDVDREASNAFTNFAKPRYYILGEDGDIRFQDSGLHDLPTQVTVLKIPAGPRLLRAQSEEIPARSTNR